MAVCRVSWGVCAGRGGRGAQVEVAAFGGGRGWAALLRWHVLAARGGGWRVGVRVWIEVNVVLVAFPAAGGVVAVTHVCAAGGGRGRDPTHQIRPVEGKHLEIRNLSLRYLTCLSICLVILSTIQQPHYLCNYSTIIHKSAYILTYLRYLPKFLPTSIPTLTLQIFELSTYLSAYLSTLPFQIFELPTERPIHLIISILTLPHQIFERSIYPPLSISTLPYYIFKLFA